jgi:hypothetical protein
LNKNEIPIMASQAFHVRDQIRYDFMMKLFGHNLNIQAMRKKYGRKADLHLTGILLAFRLLGAVRCGKTDDTCCLTSRGRYYWLVMMREFFTAVNNFRDFCRENSKY